MGIWGYICSTSDSLKRNTYGFGLAAATNINNVRINATKTLSKFMLDEKSRPTNRQVAADLIKIAAVYGCQEVFKSLPARTLFYNTVVRLLRGEGENREIKALQASVAKLEEIIKKLEGPKRAEKHKPCADLKSNVCEKLEDVRDKIFHDEDGS